jgi:LCP family protein required for cell wall assembly
MKPAATWLLLLAGALLAGCGTVPAASRAQVLPFPLLTAAPDASPTPTPFQPPDPGRSVSLFSAGVPSLEAFLPTETPSPTPIPPAEPTSTVDLNSLFPTAAAPPVFENPSDGPTPLPPLTDNETINFLLIGSDKRPGSSYRTDTLVLAVLWPAEAQVSLISIPRDLWVYIPSVGMQRINTAYQSGEIYSYPGGGPGLLKDTIAYNLGIRVDHTAMVEFDGFRRIVDTLGGMDVPVACPYTDWRLIDPTYDPYNEENWGLYTVDPGLRHMDGEFALWYARSRSKSSDFDRGRRQQEVLRSLFAQALRTDSLSHIPQLYSDLSSTVVTDLNLADIAGLALYAPKLSDANIRSFYIRPPYVDSWTTPGGAYVLLPKEPALSQLLTEATTFSDYSASRQTIGVEVQNGTTFPAWDVLASSRLNYAGYAVRISPADRADYTNSVLIDLTASQDPGARAAILRGLGLYSASEISLPDPNSPVSYRLVLGYDYQPCFQPQDLSH